MRFDRVYVRSAHPRNVVTKFFGLIGLQKIAGYQVLFIPLNIWQPKMAPSNKMRSTTVFSVRPLGHPGRLRSQEPLEAIASTSFCFVSLLPHTFYVTTNKPRNVLASVIIVQAVTLRAIEILQ